MGKLYDESIFKQREQASAQASNRLFLLVVVCAGLLLLGLAVWRWYHNPATMVININKASIEELQYLPGVGPSVAQDIAAARPFAKMDDLKKVKGIGEKTYEKMKPRVKLE